MSDILLIYYFMLIIYNDGQRSVLLFDPVHVLENRFIWNTFGIKIILGS